MLFCLYISSTVVAGLTKGGVADGKRKNYAMRKGSHRCVRGGQVLSSNQAKRSSMPCMGTSCPDTSQSSAVRRVDNRPPATRAGDRFYSAFVDETEEWAQVLIQLSLQFDYLCWEINSSYIYCWELCLLCLWSFCHMYHLIGWVQSGHRVLPWYCLKAKHSENLSRVLVGFLCCSELISITEAFKKLLACLGST